MSRFLMGVPFLGPQRRMFRSLCRQLEERPAEVEELWGSDIHRRNTVRIVSGIIAERLGWPNTRFIPQDPFRIVMWDRHSTVIDELAHEYVCAKIETAFGTKISPSQWSEWCGGTYGRVIDELLSRFSRVPVI